MTCLLIRRLSQIVFGSGEQKSRHKLCSLRKADMSNASESPNCESNHGTVRSAVHLKPCRSFRAEPKTTPVWNSQGQVTANRQAKSLHAVNDDQGSKSIVPTKNLYDLERTQRCKIYISKSRAMLWRITRLVLTFKNGESFASSCASPAAASPSPSQASLSDMASKQLHRVACSFWWFQANNVCHMFNRLNQHFMDCFLLHSNAALRRWKWDVHFTLQKHSLVI